MESIIQKTDEWFDFVSIDKNLDKVINCFSDDATLFGTFSHILSQNKLIEEYFKHFLSIKGLKVINKKYNIQRISNEIYINNTFITWEVHDKPNFTTRMSFIFKMISDKFKIIHLHSSVLPIEL